MKFTVRCFDRRHSDQTHVLLYLCFSPRILRSLPNQIRLLYVRSNSVMHRRRLAILRSSALNCGTRTHTCVTSHVTQTWSDPRSSRAHNKTRNTSTDNCGVAIWARTNSTVHTTVCSPASTRLVTPTTNTKERCHLYNCVLHFWQNTSTERSGSFFLG